jgi:toxin ParE1/3/4
MAKLILRQEAINDLNAIWYYTFKKWSESQADQYYSNLKFDCTQVGVNPKLGKKYDEIRENLFGLQSGKHIIFYQQIEDGVIEIIRILHERMDLSDRINDQ